MPRSVDEQNRVVAVGYSGFPVGGRVFGHFFLGSCPADFYLLVLLQLSKRGCSDKIFPWKRSDKSSDLHSREPYVCPSITNGKKYCFT